MKNFLLFFSFFCCSILTINAQSWIEVDVASVPKIGIVDIQPDKFILAAIDDSTMKSMLWNAPDELEFDSESDTHSIINVMLADGSIDQFSIVEYSMMEPQLAMKFKNTKTFHGISTTNSFRKIRIDYTVHGFRAVVTDVHTKTFIDHYQRGDKNIKIIYYKKDFSSNESWGCEYESDKKLKSTIKSESRFSGDCLFRSYRFAVTATGEFSNFHGATSTAQSNLVLDAIVTTVNRVNEVYEQDVTVRFILIGNVDAIFYYDPATDPFNGTSAGAMINQNQTNTDAVIGSANYDMGHIFSTGGSGLAGLGVICSNSSKARGVTGIPNPVGNPFDIDYVSHEMGHQCGANHTQNNSCNRNNATAMEPGSASTIMGYAGICNPNVQSNSDAYFHAISIQEINNEITSNNCHQIIGLNNAAPVVNQLANKNIPHSTPFVLEAVASDVDGDPLTYSWEQMDHEVGTMPPASTNSVGPMFRSLTALADAKRYLPSIDNVINNSSDIWEVLPSVGRTMDFRVTVRDHTFLPGCTDEANVTISTVANAGPFVVTSQSTVTTWLETESVTIAWNVANTNISPINCDNVDVLLSYDGGNTFSTVLATSVPNNGNAQVDVPLGLSTSARIMVKCTNNVFYNINETNIIIESGSPSFSMFTSPSSSNVCDNGTVTFTLNTNSILGFTNPINLALSGLPAGVSTSIGTNPIIPGNSTQITINNLQGNNGIYEIDIAGTSGSIVKNTNFTLEILNSTTPQGSVIVEDGTSGSVPLLPLLSWPMAIGDPMYEVQVSTMSNGGNVIFTQTLDNTSVVVAPSLSPNTMYFARVRYSNMCGTSAWSTETTFMTSTCITYVANDLPIAIDLLEIDTIVSSFKIRDRGVVTDLNITELNGTHTWINDLNFKLIASDDSELEFWSGPCSSHNDFDIKFDDAANDNTYPCPPVDGMTYQPDIPLSFFNTKQIKGIWKMEVRDSYAADGGSLDEWAVEFCLDDFCDLTIDDNNYSLLQSSINCAIDGDTIFLESIIANNTINAMNEVITIDNNIVIVAKRSDNIRILGETNGPTIVIATDAIVSLIGFDIENTESSIGVIKNDGNLILEEINLNFDTDSQSILNGQGASLLIKGNCNISGQ